MPDGRISAWEDDGFATRSIAPCMPCVCNRIERFVNRLKNSRRVATRHGRTATSFLGFVLLAASEHWISFVHATWIRFPAGQACHYCR